MNRRFLAIPGFHMPRAGRAFGAVALAIGLVLAPHAAGSTQAAHPAATDDGTLTIATPGDAADLDPASMVTAGANVMIVRNIAQTLVDYKNGKINDFEPMLATAWHSNASKSVWTFTLRKGVRFHSGRCCMTAQDVKYSIGRTILAKLAGAYIYGRYMTDPNKQIKVVNATTVQFNLGHSQPTFINAIASKNAGMIVDSKLVQSHSTKKDPWGHNWLTSHDAGTGPYVLTKWNRTQDVVMTKFPKYWGGWSGAHFSKVIIQTVAEDTTRREMIDKGTAQITWGLTPQDTVAEKTNSKVQVVEPPGTEVDYIAMTQAGPLKSPLARQGLSYAFDYNAFMQAAYKGAALRAVGPIPSTLVGYDKNTFKYTTDLKKAQTLLNRAGVKKGTTLTFMYANGYGAFKTAALILQAQLGQIGINLKIQALDQATQAGIFFGTKPASQRPNLMAYAWWPDYDDPWDMCFPYIDSASGGAAGANGGFYHNATVDSLLNKMKFASPAQVTKDAAQLQQITSKTDPPAIWVGEPLQVSILAKNLRGYIYDSLDLDTYGAYTMYMAK
jgi:peptide/nickel transport system substrate-binding protein